jgi:hypothetical protein
VGNGFVHALVSVLMLDLPTTAMVTVCFGWQTVSTILSHMEMSLPVHFSPSSRTMMSSTPSLRSMRGSS